MRSLPRPAAFTLCLLAGVLVLAYLTLDLSPTSRWVPLIVVVPLFCLILLELTRDVRGVSAEETGAEETGAEETGAEETDAEERDARSGTERGLLLWVLALPALVQALGIFVGPGLFALLYFRVKSKEPWGLALTVSALTGLGLWALFGLLLETPGSVRIPLLGG